MRDGFERRDEDPDEREDNGHAVLISLLGIFAALVTLFIIITQP